MIFCQKKHIVFEAENQRNAFQSCLLMSITISAQLFWLKQLSLKSFWLEPFWFKVFWILVLFWLKHVGSKTLAETIWVQTLLKQLWLKPPWLDHFDSNRLGPNIVGSARTSSALGSYHPGLYCVHEEHMCS